MNDDANEYNDPDNYRINNNRTTTSKYCEYKTKAKWSTSENNSRLDTKIVVPLKYLGNFWRSFCL